MGTKKTTTIPHQPQINGIYKRLNSTIINAARVTIAHESLPPEIWKLDIMDATYKYNIITHYITKTEPSRKWYPIWIQPTHVLPFVTIGSVADPRSKLTITDRSLPVRLMDTI